MTEVRGQLAFDIDDMVRQAALDRAPAWDGAPLHFTSDYYQPEQHHAAMNRYILEHGHTGAWGSHIWHATICDGDVLVPGHQLRMLSADLRCNHHGLRCQCVGDLLYQGICTDCTWHTIGTDENDPVEAFHDHALPGWRSLPVMPAKTARLLSEHSRQARAATLAWVHDNHPSEWVFDGAPVLTTRGPIGHRHVPARSPLGGYDLAAEPVHATAGGTR